MSADPIDGWAKEPGLSTSVRVAITGCPDTPTLMEKPKETASPAQWAFQRLAQSIAAFEKTLDADHEVGFNLVSFAPGEVFHAESLGYWAPDLLLFYGKNGAGLPVQLIQHVTQLSVLLVAAPKLSAAPARRIGFDILESAQDRKGPK